jgi:hypothetical protein
MEIFAGICIGLVCIAIFVLLCAIATDVIVTTIRRF